jgi:hypothetical protein
MPLAILPEFRWKTESLTSHVNPSTYVSVLSGEPFTVDHGGEDSWSHAMSAILTQDQKRELDLFWSDNRGDEFNFRWCQDGETYLASFAATPVCLLVGTMWHCRIVINRWTDLDA